MFRFIIWRKSGDLSGSANRRIVAARARGHGRSSARCCQHRGSNRVGGCQVRCRGSSGAAVSQQLVNLRLRSLSPVVVPLGGFLLPPAGHSGRHSCCSSSGGWSWCWGSRRLRCATRRRATTSTRSGPPPHFRVAAPSVSSPSGCAPQSPPVATAVAAPAAPRSLTNEASYHVKLASCLS